MNFKCSTKLIKVNAQLNWIMSCLLKKLFFKNQSGIAQLFFFWRGSEEAVPKYTIRALELRGSARTLEQYAGVIVGGVEEEETFLRSHSSTRTRSSASLQLCERMRVILVVLPPPAAKTRAPGVPPSTSKRKKTSSSDSQQSGADATSHNMQRRRPPTKKTRVEWPTDAVCYLVRQALTAWSTSSWVYCSAVFKATLPTTWALEKWVAWYGRKESTELTGLKWLIDQWELPVGAVRVAI